MSQYPPQHPPGSSPPQMPPPPMATPPPAWQPPQQPIQPPQPDKGARAFKWTIGVIGLGCVLPTVLICGGGFFGLVYIGTVGPDPEVVTGSAIKASVQQKLNAAVPLNPGEKILWFYSDALVDPTSGMYILTDQRLILYRGDSNPRMVSLLFQDITSVDANWSGGWPDDSTIFVETADEFHQFPLAPDGGSDRRFVEELEQRVRDAGGTTTAAEEEE